MQIINNNELLVKALRRSGHHAIINWISYQIKGRSFFLNDCESGKNPYYSCRARDSLVSDIDIKEFRTYITIILVRKLD